MLSLTRSKRKGRRSALRTLAHGLCPDNALCTLTSGILMVLNIEPIFAVTFLANTSSTENKTEEPVNCDPRMCIPLTRSFHDQLGLACRGDTMEGLYPHLPWSRAGEAQSQTRCRSFSDPQSQSQSAGRRTLLPSDGTASGFLAEAPARQTG